MKYRPVATIVLFKDNKILLQQRSTESNRYPNMWGAFGGKIEEGETPVEAVKREMFEELEYVLKNPILIDTGIIDREDLQTTMYTFAEEYDNSPIKLNEGQAFGWFTINEALELELTPERRTITERISTKIFELNKK
jgi:8-oxo-dGTP diphosphatase